LGFFGSNNYHMQKKLTDKDIIDINILVALNKCMSEVSHNLKYIHTGKEKAKIKKLNKAVVDYEEELDKRFDFEQKEAIEAIYDVIMDLVLEAREISLKNKENDN